MENLSLEKINSICIFQRRFRFLKNELSNINNRLIFFKDILMSMLNNLSYLNNFNIYHNTDSYNLQIICEIKEIKKLIDLFPNKLRISNLKSNNLNYYNLKLIQINNLVIKNLNFISPENINYIFKILYGDSWVNSFSNNDIDIVLFLSRFFKPICLWHSKYHKEVIKLSQNKSISSTIEMKRKSKKVTKDILENLIKGKTNNISSIIIGDSSIPSFLKSINDIIGKNKNKNNLIRNNHYKDVNCSAVLDNSLIKITKNKNSISLIEDKFGASVYVKLNNAYIVIQGLFKDDILDISKTISFVKNKFNKHKGVINYELLLVPKKFKEAYMKTLNLRDLMVCDSEELCEDIRNKYNDFKVLESKPLLTLINEFLLASKYRKIDILTLLLMSTEENKKLAFVLYDILKSKDKKNISVEIYNSLHYSIREQLDLSKNKVLEDEDKILSLDVSDIPYERRINLLNSTEEVKAKAVVKLKSIKGSFQGDNKAQAWLDGLLKIPFGVFKENSLMNFKNSFIKKIKLIDSDVSLFSEYDINNYINKSENQKIKNLIPEWDEYRENKAKYLVEIRETLNTAVYGHKEAKLQLERIFAQWINGKSKGAIIGLQGPPGTGKTSLAKNGLSKCLKDDDGKSRPFAFVPIGGSVNGSTLVGHNYTYVGSTWGRIVDVLITSKCMNPIIFIDEIDKVSNTEHGREIISILTHLTDLTQNDEFEDKYFSGIKLDLSKALIVFSFNDINLIDPILRDRISIIETKPLTLQEKITVIRDYMLPEILKDVGFNKNEIVLTDKIIKFLVETYTNEAGVRKIKEKIVDIIRDINLKRFHDSNIVLPYTIDEDYIKLLFENKPKVRIKKISKEPSIGLVNGLYATTTGIGGLTVIQVMKYPSDKMLELDLTGKQGDVMKESMNYALKIAFSLLTEEQQNDIINKSNEKKNFGLHIHTPEAAVPKDGPSAGAAITLAIYSILSGKKVNNKVALTGEIDLCRNVTAIGGVYAKLNGAKKAGVTKALIPEENLEDLERLRRENLSPEDDNFKVFTISTIYDVLKHCIIDFEMDDLKEKSMNSLLGN
jgi:ATP-dependent Lon protease